MLGIKPTVSITYSNCLVRFIDAIGASNIEKLDQSEGFIYKDGRDLTGFIDGSRNASFFNIILDVAVIHNYDDKYAADYEGGSFVYAGRWIHDLKKVRFTTFDNTL